MPVLIALVALVGLVAVAMAVVADRTARDAAWRRIAAERRRNHGYHPGDRHDGWRPSR